jgi:hypothetical protein
VVNHVPEPRGPSRYYTVKDLADLWQTTRQVVWNYLSQMRHQRQLPPRPDQVRVKRLNAARKHLLIRDDYAALIEQHMISRHVKSLHR